MPLYKIADTAFAHASTSTWHWKSKRGVEWYRGPNYYKTCFFTDSSIPSVDNVKAEIKVAWLIEPPVICSSSYDYVRQNHHKFNYILTYDIGLIAMNPSKFLYYPMSGSWIPENERAIYPKNKLISIVASDKQQAPGHRLRHEIIGKFRNRMDVYGCGFHKFTHPKTPFLKDYMFSLAILNSNFDDYYTEILTDTLVTGTIPIFWGTKNIGKYFNTDGIIRFDTINEFEMILGTLSKELYDSKLEAIKENFDLANKYIVAEDYIFDHYRHLFQ